MKKKERKLLKDISHLYNTVRRKEIEREKKEQENRSQALKDTINSIIQVKTERN